MPEGRVAQWHDEEGWGVIESDETPGGVWCHFGAIAGPGYHVLVPGEPVVFEYERAEQDGYRFRATSVGSPAPIRPVEASSALDSTIEFRFD